MNKKTIILAIAAFVIMIIVAAILYFILPPYLYNQAIESQRKDAHLTIKSAEISGIKMVYAEGGVGDAIIMLHGLGGNKDLWLQFAKYFTPHYRVIIPDLPGFGDSSRSLDININVMPQVEKLNLFAKELKLTRFHLVGNSYGGNIAGNYAATYPEMVKTLALFDSGGVICPQKSEFDLLVEKGTNPLIVKDENDFHKFLERNFLKPPQMPSFIIKYLIKQRMKDASRLEIYEKKWKGNGLLDDFFILESKLNKITTPTLIVWGDSDNIIHISCVPIFEKNINNSKSVIIKGCGHMPMVEKPAETAAAYREFLKGKNQ